MQYAINGKGSDDLKEWEAHVAAMKELLTLLRAHDWTYEWSDDHSVWTRGVEQKKEIEAKAKVIGRDGERLLKAYRDVQFGPAHSLAYIYSDSEGL